MNPTVEGFMDKFYNISPRKMAEAGILTEFRKHADLVVPFADDVVKALKGVDSAAFAKAESKMAKYLRSCGTFQSKISSINQWVQLMSITGLLHGGTLSFTRFIGSKDVARWRNSLSDTWDAGDVNLITGGLGTVTGNYRSAGGRP